MGWDAEHQVVVVGGGLAGVCASIAAARLGVSVALVQDRPVLGGNSSSEIRVIPGGADHSFPYARETGIIEELRIEDRFRNHERLENGRTNSIWDFVLWEWVTREPNITLYLNTSARSAVTEGNHIRGIVAEQLGTERTLRIAGEVFVDASGDGTVAASAGAQFRMGREGREEFGESLAPERPDGRTLGSSVLFLARDLGHPVKFTPPPWAYDFPSDEDLPFRDHSRISNGFWWIEFGGTLNTISDNERIRDELWKIVFGVWDHIKNHGDHGAENYALEWVGSLPGKRESRRFMGDYILTQHDLEEAPLFPDRVAYGGWPIDLHPPEGIYEAGKPAQIHPLPRPYSIPFRCLYSRNVDNLLFAGRNISASHVAFGSTRVMATGAVMGQAAGTGAFLCVRYRTTPRGVLREHIWELQQLLLKHDAYIIGLRNEDPEDLARKARASASSWAQGFPPGKVVDGVARPEDGDFHQWASDPSEPLPQWVELDFGREVRVGAVYITFDTNLDRLVDFGPAPECVRDYTISVWRDGRWVPVVREKGNYHRRRVHRFGPLTTTKLRLTVEATNGDPSARVYEIRCYERG